MTIVLGSIFVAAMSAAISEPAQAFSSGIVGRSGNPDTNSGSTCTACHTPGAPVPTIAIDMPAVVTAGEVVDVTVTLTGGPAVVGGFNVSTSFFDGELIADGIETQIVNEQITHTAPKPFVGGEVSFNFQWVPPTQAGVVEVFAAGVSANSAAGNSGDGVDNTSTVVTVEPAAVLGDVNCTGALEIADALFIAQFAIAARTDGGSCPLANPATEMVAAQGDVDGSGGVSVLDALMVAQCQVGQNNVLCP